jgi:hypothetical protein
MNVHSVWIAIEDVETLARIHRLYKVAQIK